jgi:hypothetical protein
MGIGLFVLGYGKGLEARRLVRGIGFEIVRVKNQPEGNDRIAEGLMIILRPGRQVILERGQAFGAYLQAYIDRIDQRIQGELSCAVLMLRVMLARNGFR